MFLSIGDRDLGLHSILTRGVRTHLNFFFPLSCYLTAKLAEVHPNTPKNTFITLKTEFINKHLGEDVFKIYPQSASPEISNNVGA